MTYGAKERVEQEAMQLEMRLRRLRGFMISDDIVKLSKEQRLLLRAQEGVMSTYLDILRGRLSLWEEER